MFHVYNQVIFLSCLDKDKLLQIMHHWNLKKYLILSLSMRLAFHLISSVATYTYTLYRGPFSFKHKSAIRIMASLQSLAAFGSPKSPKLSNKHFSRPLLFQTEPAEALTVKLL